MQQIETVRREFTKQAKNFEAYQTIFSKEEFNALAIEQMRLTGKERALEVAAGTCASSTESVSLGGGIYVVRIDGGHVFKVMVR